METLEGLDGRQSTPEDGFNVPDSNGTHQTAEAVAEQADRNGAQDDGGRAQREIVEQFLRRKNLRAGSSVRGGRCRDGTDGVLLERPRPWVDELEEPDLEWEFTLASVGPPPGFELVSSGKEGGPGNAKKVREEDDEGSLNSDHCWFELRTGVVSKRYSSGKMQKPRQAGSPHRSGT